MESRLAVLAICLAFVQLLSGCATPAPGEDARLENALGPSDVVPIDLAGSPEPLADGDPWGTLKVQAAGAAGAWLVVYQPLPVATSTIEYVYAYDVVATSAGDGPVGVFVLPPSVVHAFGNETAPGMPVANEARLFPFEGGTEIHLNASAERSWSGGENRGLLLVIGSNAAWTASISARIGDGNVTGPAWSRTGNGTTLSFPGQGGLSQASPGVTVSSAYLQHPRGWTHIELQNDPFAREGHGAARACTLVLAGKTEDCTTLGAQVHTFGYVPVDVWGYSNNSAGDSGIEVTSAYSSSAVTPSVIHLPSNGPMLPEGMQAASYRYSKHSEPY